MNWNEFKKKNRIFVDYIISRDRTIVHLSHIEAFGYNLDCILRDAKVFTAKNNEVEIGIDYDRYLELYGLTPADVRLGIQTGIDRGLIFDSTSSDNYRIDVNEVNRILSEVQDRRYMADAVEVMQHEPASN